MNDTILIILLVLMAATFVKVVVGAMRSKKQKRENRKVEFIVQPTAKSFPEKYLLASSSVLVRPPFASSYIFNNLNTIRGFSRRNRVSLEPSFY